jgi:glyoxylase-like metal-dependent hydrolase (beta-lactamase superfamily II)
MGAAHGEGFTEIAEGCFLARYAAWDTTIGAVVGLDGVLVIDTRATYPHGLEIREQVKRIAPNAPVRWVVNTHEHFDHVLGNAAFADAAVLAHEVAAASMTDAVERIREAIRADPQPDRSDPAITAAVLEGVLTSPLRLPDKTFTSVTTIDLGDQLVELLHPGRGHTAGDLVVRVPASDVVFAGDLIEESAAPAFGSDCFPLEWATSLDIVVGLTTDSTVLVPGHGAAVGRDFVQQQRSDVSDVAELIRSLYQQGVPAAEALAVGKDDWAFPPAGLEQAVQRGYRQLRESGAVAGGSPAVPPIGTRSLPLA